MHVFTGSCCSAEMINGTSRLLLRKETSLLMRNLEVGVETQMKNVIISSRPVHRFVLNSSPTLPRTGSDLSSFAVGNFTVNSLADPGDGICDATECTLREAIPACKNRLAQ